MLSSHKERIRSQSQSLFHKHNKHLLAVPYKRFAMPSQRQRLATQTLSFFNMKNLYIHVKTGFHKRGLDSLYKSH